PMCVESCGRFSIHGVAAVSFFVCIALVAIFCNSNTLKFIPSPELRQRYRRWYVITGVGMVAGPLLAFFFQGSRWVFWAEAAGVWVFALYWAIKTHELRRTQVDKSLARGTAP